jgi:hypothetical protein
LALVAAVPALVSAGGPAAAAPATLTDVYAALGVDKVPADYIVMVDVSASMQQAGRYAAVKDSLRAFFAALAPDDQVTLGAFAGAVQIVYQGPAGRSPDKLVETLPAAATGAWTDIGAAIEATVNRLRRPDAPGIATIVLLSDGQHSPPNGSAYPFESGYAWDQLTGAVRGMTKTSLKGYAVPLAGATGARLLGKVFPNTQVIDPASIDQLTTRLELPKAAARVAKARSVLGDDPARPVRVQWPSDVGAVGAGRTRLAVRLTSATSHLPLTVDGFSIDTGDRTLHATVQEPSVRLAPGGSATVTVLLDWDAGPLRFAPLSTVARSARLTLSAKVGSPWAAVLTNDLSVTLAAQLTGGQADAHLAAQRGSVWLWLLGVVLLALVLLGLARLRQRRLQPSLSGSLHVTLPDGRGRQLPLSGRIAALNQSTIGLPGYGEVRMSRPSVRTSVLELVITYSRDGSTGARETQLCGLRKTVTVSGVDFTWQAGMPTQRGPRPSPDPAGSGAHQ